MKQEDLKKFTLLLEKELDSLIEELNDVGFINPDNPADWVPKPDDLNISPPDSNELADTIEEFEENSAVLKELEIRFNEVKAALERIKEGTYGICEVSGEPIPIERLEANPAAKTLVQFADQVK
jgi:RNA polymerase-binding transcription factor DksA